MATGKGLIGVFPGGSLVTELIGTVIPNRRMDKAEKLISLILAQQNHLSPDEVQAKMSEPEFVDLLEKGLKQSITAVSEDRIQRIANILSHGLNNEVENLVLDVMLSEIEDISDFDLIVLCKISIFIKEERYNGYYWEKDGEITENIDDYLSLEGVIEYNYKKS